MVPEILRMLNVRRRFISARDRQVEERDACTLAVVGMLAAGAAVIVGRDAGCPFVWGTYGAAAGIGGLVTVRAWAAASRARVNWAVVGASTAMWFDMFVEVCRLRELVAALRRRLAEPETDQVECRGTDVDPAQGRADHAGHRRAA